MYYVNLYLVLIKKDTISLMVSCKAYIDIYCVYRYFAALFILVKKYNKHVIFVSWYGEGSRLLGHLYLFSTVTICE